MIASAPTITLEVNGRWRIVMKNVSMRLVMRAIVLCRYSVGTALVTLLVPFFFLVVAVQRGPDCTAGTAHPWAGPAFIVATLIAACFTVAAWLVPGWRHRHLASGATVGLTVLVVLALLVFGGLDYQASVAC